MKNLKMKKLITEARKTEFTMFSDNGKLYVINEEYKKTGSMSTSSYQDITFNSSYLLAALQYLMEKELI